MTAKEVLRRYKTEAKQPQLRLVEELWNMVNNNVVLTKEQVAVLERYLDAIVFHGQKLQDNALLDIATWVNSCGGVG
jgi:hypothetical protein